MFGTSGSLNLCLWLVYGRDYSVGDRWREDSGLPTRGLPGAKDIGLTGSRNCQFRTPSDCAQSALESIARP